MQATNLKLVVDADAAAKAPRSVPIERSVLGAILADNGLVDQLHLSRNDFFERLHQDIYDAIVETRDTSVATPLTLELRFSVYPRVTSSMSAYQYICTLSSDACTAGQAIGYANQLKDLTARRTALEARSMLDHALNLDTPLRDILSAASRKLDDSHTETGAEKAPDTMGEAVLGVVARMGKPETEPRVRIGMPNLQEQTGDWLPGMNIVLAGATGSQKSMLAQQIGINAALNGATVAIASLEMKADQIGRRALASVLRRDGVRVSTDEIRKMSDHDPRRPAVVAAAHKINAHQMHLFKGQSLTMSSFNSWLRTLHRNGKRVDLVIVDYLALAQADPIYKGNKTVEMTEMSREMKTLAMRYDCVVLMLHQINRSHASRDDKRPSRTDLRDSGQIEANADIVMLCYRDVYYATQELRALGDGSGSTEKEADLRARIAEMNNVLEVIVDKNRDGMMGSQMLHTEPEYAFICSRTDVS